MSDRAGELKYWLDCVWNRGFDMLIEPTRVSRVVSAKKRRGDGSFFVNGFVAHRI